MSNQSRVNQMLYISKHHEEELNAHKKKKKKNGKNRLEKRDKRNKKLKVLTQQDDEICRED
jgi:hypothetical protein